jgi:hypothetical protein
MPVVECSCGMVMSISVARPRHNCIRCGSSEIREVEWRGSAPVVAKQSTERSLATKLTTQRVGAGATQVGQHEVLVNRDYAI